MRKRILCKIAVSLLILGVIAIVVEATISMNNKNKKEKITVYLWSTNLLENYAPYIQSKVPEAEIEFRVGDNNLNFYENLKNVGDMPDIITNRRFSVYDSKHLKDSLMDLSATQEAASYYTTYLENYRNADDTINWLPVCGELDGIIANKDLFDKYNISIPTDYKSFVSACKKFEKHGIRGFATDFVYDYTCLEVLQGASISNLMSLEGKKWRSKYEDPENGYSSLDDKVWPKVFDKMEQVIKDINLKPSDKELEYDDIVSLYDDEKIAMFRGIANDMKGNAIFLPYFCDNDEKWLLTYPSFHVSLSKKLEENPNKKELAFKILDVMLSEEGQNVLANKRDVITYNRDVKLDISDKMDNLESTIKSNYIYIRLATDKMFNASCEVVQKMLEGKYNSKEAYKRFNELLEEVEISEEKTVATFDRSYKYEFNEKGGNEAASVVANTLRKMYDADVLVAPMYNFTSSIYKGEYTEYMLSSMIMNNSTLGHIGKIKGSELKKWIRASLQTQGYMYTPFNNSSLPVISGATMYVKNNKDDYELERLTINDEEIKDNKEYKVVYLATSQYFNDMSSKIVPSNKKVSLEEKADLVRVLWTEYIKEGNKLSKPSEYINIIS